jgi:DNA-binding protein HU-beta
MNKATLIDKIASDAGITKTAAATALDSLVEGITGSLKKNQRVTLVGFGTWGVTKRKARTGRNPQTGETIKIKAKKSVRFKPGKQLESALNKGR